MRSPAHVVGLALLLLVAGCGGGDGSGGTLVTADPSTDLTLFSDGSTNPAFVGLNVGDTSTDLGMRAGLRFGLFPAVPTGAVVTSAYLHLQQAATVGTPFGTLGTVVVDRVDFGVALTAADYAPTVLGSAVATASMSASVGVREIDVTAAVAADVAAGALSSDFLLRFTGANPNGIQEYVTFEDSENSLGTADVPKLVIVYQ